MAAKIGFREHILLLFFINVMVLFMNGNSTTSFIGQLLSDPTNINFTDGSDFYLLFASLFIGIGLIGVTTGSNFAGIFGVISQFLAKIGPSGAAITTIGAILIDYVLVYNTIVQGVGTDWVGGWVRIFTLLFIMPLFIDAAFSTIDWVRGVQT